MEVWLQYRNLFNFAVEEGEQPVHSVARFQQRKLILIYSYNCEFQKKGVFNSPTVHASLEKNLNDYCKIGNKQEAAVSLSFCLNVNRSSLATV